MCYSVIAEVFKHYDVQLVILLYSGIKPNYCWLSFVPIQFIPSFYCISGMKSDDPANESLICSNDFSTMSDTFASSVKNTCSSRICSWVENMVFILDVNENVKLRIASVKRLKMCLFLRFFKTVVTITSRPLWTVLLTTRKVWLQMQKWMNLTVARRNAFSYSRILSVDSVENDVKLLWFDTDLPSYEVFAALVDYLQNRTSQDGCSRTDSRALSQSWKTLKTVADDNAMSVWNTEADLVALPCTSSLHSIHYNARLQQVLLSFIVINDRNTSQFRRPVNQAVQKCRCQHFELLNLYWLVDPSAIYVG